MIWSQHAWVLDCYREETSSDLSIAAVISTYVMQAKTHTFFHTHNPCRRTAVPELTRIVLGKHVTDPHA